ncbi:MULTISPECIES: DnaJ C-terminal domain-containing protein [Paracoccus]|jgi:DnaJ-class molecular chaperone|uniref:Chaperone DnaJ domain protein n=1 Tax=Paracoccus denitrificans (strain Pd 1222) TaxID=318586 RepID=A1AZC5_PARDP|nr:MULTISPECIES: DnaJ C-terminal domain-containing protein [Paracoccus]ABL68619.1 chaperone DnaJ domain protein [Paracoccus denitrificans PD1222]MBB4625657.1 DnaJ-class molecular chaperone [Paracoccus denitrificans]MCU7427174.1 DnaJ domain-containing protein [Paracoccus denitrificans]QAR26677.1 J domain-containing protein [Paracoccus denitrificans]UPV95626.1 DnaJ domain-containing protein [Paracoccus denitrificans]
MADDPYKALGLGKNASQDDIKKAYRRIAKTDHPDLNPDPAAHERFKAASSAYDLLKDPEQRARFDRGEIDAQGQEQPQRHYYREYAESGDNPYRQHHGFDDLSDVFSDLFGGRGGGGGGRRGGARSFDMRGSDQRFTLEIDFMTAARGGSTRITMPDGSVLEVKIPEGAHDGQVIRLRGKGGPGMGNGEPGDALLTLIVAEDPDWHRDGNDVETTLPITIDEAVLGGKVEAQTIDGPVMLTVPRGASSGRKLRLKGRGIKGADGRRGDQHVVLKIVMPPQIDSELARFMEDWRQNHAYDPRRGK